MHRQSIYAICILLGLVAFTVTAPAQTSVALNVYGAFSSTTSNGSVQQSPANSAGGLFELRHISNPILGFEGTYAFNRSNQTYRGPVPYCPAGVGPCPTPFETIRADAHEVTADWTPSVHIANLRAFGVLGAGVLLNVPTSGQSHTSTSGKAVYVYGAGLDWGLLPHLGLRVQYRGNLYRAPDLTSLYTSTNRFTSTAEPVIGAYFNF